MRTKSLTALLLLCLFHGTSMAESSQHVTESPLWLTYPGGEDPCKGKHIVLISAETAARLSRTNSALAGRNSFAFTSADIRHQN